MGAVLFLHVLTLIVELFGSAYILFRNPSDRRSLAFVAMGVAHAGWTLALFSLLTDIARTDIVARLSFACGGLYLVALLWFVLEFPDRVKHWSVWRFVLPTLALALGLMPFAPKFLTAVRVSSAGAITADFDAIWYPAWSLVFLIVMFAPFVALLVRRAYAATLDRLRIQQIFFGFLLMFIPQVVTNLVLPLAFHDYRWNNLGPVFTLLMLPFMANAILRYRLLDIRWIISKSLIFSGIIAFVVWVLMGVSYLLARIISPQAAFIVGTFVVALVIVPTARVLERWMNAMFNRGGYDPEDLMNRMFAIARSELDVRVLSEKMLAELMAAFGAQSAMMAAFAPQTTRVISLTRKGYPESVGTAVPPLVALMKKHPNQLIESAELEWNVTYGDEGKRHPDDKRALVVMHEREVDLLMPLMMEGRLVAFIALGNRRYDRVLRQADVNILNLLRAGIAPAIENAEKFAEMQELYGRLKESDIVKSQFIDTISHQFRTPLASIRWNVETLGEDAELSADDAGMVKEVQANVNFLVRTMELFTDVIQFESDAVHLDMTPFASSELMPLFDRYATEAKVKGIAWSTRIEPVNIAADKKYVLRALEEVLRNAVEYTDTGGRVAVSVTGDEGRIRIEVADTGIGMSDVDATKRAFTKFYRGKNAILAHPDGIGLGLYLVKLVAARLGGFADLRSGIGKGTSVGIVLSSAKMPINQNIREAKGKTRPRPSKRKSITS